MQNSLSGKDRHKLTALIELERNRIIEDRTPRDVVAKQMSGKLGRGVTTANIASVYNILGISYIARRHYPEIVEVVQEEIVAHPPIQRTSHNGVLGADALLSRTRDMSFLDRFARVELQIEAIRQALNAFLTDCGRDEVSQEPF